MMSFKTECTIVLRSPPSLQFPPLNDKGEVEYFSILDNKVATKTYWEARMLANMDDTGGWESVANVRFQALNTAGNTQGTEGGEVPAAAPPPEFLPAPPPQFDNSPTESEGSCPPSLDVPLVPITPTGPPTKQYVYGVTETKTVVGARVVETVAKRVATQENMIEAEIRAQQAREEQLAGRDKGAASPHDSDEGFVDRDDRPAPPPSPPYIQTITGESGEPIIYDAVSPPPQYTQERQTPTLPANTTETKIAMEIRELKEREDELRRMREQLLAATSRDNLLGEEEEEGREEEEEEGRDDHLTSLTTTTDEGNFSECGDAASSKSSDGSNSRVMSPEVPSTGGPSAPHTDYPRGRKVTVKPYQDQEEEEQPVYIRMQKESVIEREIRLSREREEAYRREKGITSSSPAPPRPSQTQHRASLSNINDGRDVQHRLATSRIQLEIQETSMKERELKDAGSIITMSEDTVDSKVTRISDFSEASHSSQSESPRPRSITPASTPSPRSPASPVPNFTPSPAPPRINTSNLTRSLSTTNLSNPSSNSRAPKGLMQKFIASRGKMTGSAFSSPPPSITTTTSRGIPTRPMRVEPKAAVVQRESLARMKPASEQNGESDPQKQSYRRTYCTAEEKIQSELRDMQMREEELRRLRARQLALSQPNLAEFCHDDQSLDDQEEEDEEEELQGFQEMNGLRAAHSNPNLLDQPDIAQMSEKGVRRRSALIAQWENRIQQTTDT